jgi:N-acetylglucosamine-6-phosphate deacetylase
VNGVLTPATIEIDGARIIEVVSEFHSGSDIKLSETDGILIPGMIDLQINGGFGIDFQSTDRAGFLEFRKQVLKTGVTGFLPTLITASQDNLIKQLAEIDLDSQSGMSDSFGVHLEGPFISLEARGTHDPKQVRAIDLSEIKILLESKKIKLITLAPELEGALDAIEYLVNKDVIVSLGHSMATSEQSLRAVEKGARMVTHIFNAQSGVHHRDSGLALQALINPQLFLGTIADLHHLSKEIIKLIFQTAADRVVLVTDAISALGMPNGTFDLGNQTVIVEAGNPPKRSDGVIAGSAVRMDESVKNVIDCGVQPELAIAAATSIPAKVLGLSDKGQIKKGFTANLALLSDTGRVTRVWHLGEEVSID